MQRIKKSSTFRVISLLLIFTFISLDISYAYTPEHNANNSTLAIPSALQQQPVTPQAEAFQRSVFNDGALLGSAYSIGKYLLEDGIKLKTLAGVLGAELGDAAKCVDLSHVTVALMRNGVLNKIDSSAKIPKDAIILIPYTKRGKKGIVEIALKDNVAIDRLPGYQWVISDKYVVRALPEGYVEKSAKSAATEEITSDIIMSGQNVSDNWRRAVRDGEIKVVFKRLFGEKEEEIALGVRISADNETEYYGRNLTRNEDIDAKVDDKSEGSFTVQLNEFRGLRPGVEEKKILGRQPDSPSHEEKCQFACRDSTNTMSLLTRNPLAELDLNGTIWRAYNNASPFEKDGHFVLVPDIFDDKQIRMQEVIEKDISDIASLMRASQNVLIFFNSLHAGASVNHIHFQGVKYKKPTVAKKAESEKTLAIDRAESKPILYYKDVTISRLTGYPADGYVFESANTDTLAEAVWKVVDKLQQRKTPFNLIFIGSKVYLFVRNIENEIIAEFPTGVLASMEMAGKLIVSDKKTYYKVKINRIKSALAKSCLDAEDTISIFIEALPVAVVIEAKPAEEPKVTISEPIAEVITPSRTFSIRAIISTLLLILSSVAAFADDYANRMAKPESLFYVLKSFASAHPYITGMIVIVALIIYFRGYIRDTREGLKIVKCALGLEPKMSVSNIAASVKLELAQMEEASHQLLFALVQSEVPKSMKKIQNALDELKPLSEQSSVTADAISTAIAQTKKKHKLSEEETQILWLALTGPGQGMGDNAEDAKEQKISQLFETLKLSDAPLFAEGVLKTIFNKHPEAVAYILQVTNLIKGKGKSIGMLLECVGSLIDKKIILNEFDLEMAGNLLNELTILEKLLPGGLKFNLYQSEIEILEKVHRMILNGYIESIVDLADAVSLMLSIIAPVNAIALSGLPAIGSLEEVLETQRKAMKAEHEIEEIFVGLSLGPTKESSFLELEKWGHSSYAKKMGMEKSVVEDYTRFLFNTQDKKDIMTCISQLINIASSARDKDISDIANNALKSAMKNDDLKQYVEKAITRIGDVHRGDTFSGEQVGSATLLKNITTEILTELKEKKELAPDKLFVLTFNRIPENMVDLIGAMADLKPLSEEPEVNADVISRAIAQAKEKHQLSDEDTKILWLALTGPGQGIGESVEEQKESGPRQSTSGKEAAEKNTVPAFVTLMVNKDLQGLWFKDVEQAIASGKMAIAEVSVDWAKKIKETYPDEVYTIFISPLSEAQIKERMQEKGQTREEVIFEEMKGRQEDRAKEKPTSEEKQLARAQAAVTEMARQNEYDTVIVSNKLKDLERDAIRWSGEEGAEVAAQFMNAIDNARKSGKKLIRYSGPSATGKTPLWNLVQQTYGSQFSRIVIYTTRDMRPGEEDKIDYYFRSGDDLKELESGLNSPFPIDNSRKDMYVPGSADEAYDAVIETLAKIRNDVRYYIFEPKIDKRKVEEALSTGKAACIGSVVFGYDADPYSGESQVAVNFSEGALVLDKDYNSDRTRYKLERLTSNTPVSQNEGVVQQDQLLNPGRLSTLKSWLGSNSPEYKMMAAIELRKWGRNAVPALDALLENLNYPYDELNAQCALTIVNIGSRDALSEVKRFAKQLSSDDERALNRIRWIVEQFKTGSSTVTEEKTRKSASGVEELDFDRIPKAEDSRIKCIVFDWGNVISRFDYEIAAQSMARHFNVDEKTALDFFEKRESDPANPIYRYEKNIINEHYFIEEFSEWIRNNTRLKSQEFAIKDLEEIFNSIWSAGNIPETVSLIKALRSKGYKVRILSRANTVHYRYFWSNPERTSLLDGRQDFYYSILSGVSKPRAESYLKVVKDAGLAPEESLFIGYNQADVDGAVSAGLSAAQFDPKDAAGSVRGILDILEKEKIAAGVRDKIGSEAQIIVHALTRLLSHKHYTPESLSPIQSAAEAARLKLLSEAQKRYLKHSYEGGAIAVADLAYQYESAARILPDKMHKVIVDSVIDGQKVRMELPLPKDETPDIARDYLLTRLYNIMAWAGPSSIEVYAPKELKEFIDYAKDKLLNDKNGYVVGVEMAQKMNNNKVFVMDIRDIGEAPSGVKTKKDIAGTIDKARLEGRLEKVKAIEGLAVGVDVGGTDVKLAVMDKNGIVLLKKHVWSVKPKDFTSGSLFHECIETLIKFGMALTALKRLEKNDIAKYGLGALKKKADEACGNKKEILENLAALTKEIEDKLIKEGIKVTSPSSIGISFPDMVSNGEIVGGMTSKTAKLRDIYTKNGVLGQGYWDEFNSEIRPLARIISENITRYYGQNSLIPFAIANDGDVGTLWAAVLLGKGNIFNFSLGTSLAGGVVNEGAGISKTVAEPAYMKIFIGPEGYKDFKHNARDIFGCGQQLLSQDVVFTLAKEKGLIEGYPTGREDDTLVMIRDTFWKDQEKHDKVREIFGKVGELTAVTAATLHYAMVKDSLSEGILFGRVVESEAGLLVMREANRVLKERYSGNEDLERIKMQRASELPGVDSAEADKMIALAQAIGAAYLGNAARAAIITSTGHEKTPSAKGTVLVTGGASQLFEIIESYSNGVKIVFVDAGNRLISMLEKRQDISGGFDNQLLGIERPTAEIVDQIEKTIEAAERQGAEKLPKEIVDTIEYLRKNLAQFEADGGVASLIVLARKAKREGQKLIIGLETDWIPGINVKGSLQRNAIAALMKEIDALGEALKSMGIDNVEVKRGSGSELASILLKEADDTHTSMHNIIVMASVNTINSDSFTALKNADESDRPFLAGIDSAELLELYDEFGEASTKQLYTRLTQMLYMTLELASGKEPPNIPTIVSVSYDREKRLVIYLPKAEPRDYQKLKEIYKAEAVALQSC